MVIRVAEGLPSMSMARALFPGTAIIKQTNNKILSNKNVAIVYSLEPYET